MSDLFIKTEAKVLQTGLNAMTNANTALLNQNKLLMQQINWLKQVVRCGWSACLKVAMT